MMIIVVLYLLGCAVTGFMGRNTAWGFTGHFFLSLVITPIGDFIVQRAGRPSRAMLKRLARSRAARKAEAE
jgi:hypothetical protein